jgi:NAD-reducing hydrogenase small subunit
MAKLRFATVWLGGCSGCHMSFLDLDEWLIDLAARADVVFSPVGTDRKDYPGGSMSRWWRARSPTRRTCT